MHCLECNEKFNWTNHRRKRSITEGKKDSCQELKKAKTNKRRKVFNHDEVSLIKTITWTSPFVKITEKETNTKT